jgi:hypothetical protein
MILTNNPVFDEAALFGRAEISEAKPGRSILNVLK